MSDSQDEEQKEQQYVSDVPVYHENKRYAPGTVLPASAVKALPEHATRKATKADLKAAEEAQRASEIPTENPDAEEQGAGEA